jgi:hypothetical protein
MPERYLPPVASDSAAIMDVPSSAAHIKPFFISAQVVLTVTSKLNTTRVLHLLLSIGSSTFHNTSETSQLYDAVAAERERHKRHS